MVTATREARVSKQHGWDYQFCTVLLGGRAVPQVSGIDTAVLVAADTVCHHGDCDGDGFLTPFDALAEGMPVVMSSSGARSFIVCTVPMQVGKQRYSSKF